MSQNVPICPKMSNSDASLSEQTCLSHLSLYSDVNPFRSSSMSFYTCALDFTVFPVNNYFYVFVSLFIFDTDVNPFRSLWISVPLHNPCVPFASSHFHLLVLKLISTPSTLHVYLSLYITHVYHLPLQIFIF